jgi:diguanylate cyclase (GGDEF)-like protein
VKKLVSVVPESTYIELVRGLFRTMFPTCIMALSFAAVGVLVSLQTHDDILTLLTILGTLAAAWRLLVVFTGRRASVSEALSLLDAQRLERRFAFAYLSFAGIFSLLSWRAFVIATPEAHVLIVGLIFGYAAGVAAGVSFRPWISVSAIVIAVTPAMMQALLAPNSAYRAVGCLLAIFLAGGVQSMISRYRYAALSITTGFLFASLARSDPLTGLPNRLALAERFHQIIAQSGEHATVAVHCLDLDRFKAVNDQYGHPIGDLLLKAVADRLTRALRQGDFAVRVGGDEFVIIQARMANRDEADLMGRRVVRALSEPYAIGEHVISIGASIGYALSSAAGYELEQMIRSADGALLRAKEHRGTAVYADEVATPFVGRAR